MAIVKAFKGLRPPVDIVKQLASRPYDVLNSDEARYEAKGNPDSLLHITKAVLELPDVLLYKELTPTAVLKLPFLVRNSEP